MKRNYLLITVFDIVSNFNSDILSSEHEAPFVIAHSEYAQLILAKSRKRSFRRKLVGCIKRELTRLEKKNNVSCLVLKKAWCSLLIRAFEAYKSVQPPNIYEWELVLPWAAKAKTEHIPA